MPLSLYFKHGRVKMEVGLCKGKKLYDKRADAAQRDAKRSIDRAMKSNGNTIDFFRPLPEAELFQSFLHTARCAL